MTKPNYSIEVYNDHAIIQGLLSSDVLVLLLKLCEKEGFTYLVPNDDKPGFKLVYKLLSST